MTRKQREKQYKEVIASMSNEDKKFIESWEKEMEFIPLKTLAKRLGKKIG